jgi:hypothetical protein
MKSLKDYIFEEDKKKKTKTKDQEADWSGLDDLFNKPADQLPAAPSREPEREPEAPDAPNTPPLRRASQQDTLRRAGNITPTDDMRNMLNRMRDIENDPDDTGYPDPEEPENLPDVRVTPANLPNVINNQLTAGGVQNPDWHTVANLPGNMSRAIRTLGKQLFRSFTRTPTDDIVMLGNVNNQGPNSRQEINAVANWVRETGEDIGLGNIDFDRSIPGYDADISQYSAGGARFLLVRDQFGQYIYTWPERDSLEQRNQQQLGQERPRLAR